MDSSIQQTKLLNPVENASLLSKVTYLFTLPLFRKGELSENDIYKTLKSYSTTNLGNKLEADWIVEKKRKRPWLLNSLLRLFGRKMFLLGLLVLVVDSAAVTVKPLLIGQIIKFFDPKQTHLTLKSGVMYCCVLIACLSISGLVKQFCTFQADQLVQRIKIACSALVYRKLLKLPVNQNSRGQAITLITKDLNSADMLLLNVYYLVIGLFQIIIMSYIMYSQIGVSTFIGLSWLLLYIPLQAIFGKCEAWFRLRAAAETDKRLRETQEIFTAARVIKMYTWEAFHINAVENHRQKEMAYIRLYRCFEGIAWNFGTLSTKLIFCISIVSYVSLGYNLTAEKVFTVTTCIRMLYGFIQISIPVTMSQYANFVAAMQRFTNFFLYEEVIDKSDRKRVLEIPPQIMVKNLSLKLTNTFVLNNVSFQIINGLAMVKGLTGSGKSTFLLTLLEEIQITNGTVEVNGTLSYASQEPWLFPGTVRQNIVFGERYDRERYQTIIKACSLQKDFESFSNGDATYITDRGLTLSRGQKTRINLARCVYKIADIYLLDDCLSALDTLVSKQIFDQCIKRLLESKICIMTTHENAYIQDVNYVLELGQGSLSCQTIKNDSVNNSDSNSDTLTPTVKSDIRMDHNYIDVQDPTETTKLLANTNENKNTYKEFNEAGGVAKKVYYFYFSSGSGIWMPIVILILLIAWECTSSYSDYFVSVWVNSEQKLSGMRNNQEANITEYKKLEERTGNILIQYSGVVVASICLVLLSYIMFLFFSYAVSVNIHRTILSKILSGSMQFFDKNLSGNILNRFSRDLSIIDEQLPFVIFFLVQMTLMMIATLGMVSAVKPFLLIPSCLLVIILYIARSFYVPTSRSIRRLEGSTRSPIVGHINATADGITTIRANKMQSVLIKEFEKHQDVYNSVMYMNISTSSAFTYLLDMLCTIYIGVVILTTMFFKDSMLSGQAGLAITQSITLSGSLLQFGVRLWTEIENLMTSVERTMAYTKVEPENKLGFEPSNWPNKGVIVYRNVNLKYPLTGDLVLKHINFVVDSKEKLGVIGRTGSGKSSLVSVLFRLYDFNGSVTIDGIETSKISLPYLRSKTSIIPQDPFLFTGTIRENLDPNNKFSDKQLWYALEEVEMKTVVDSLDAPITEGGNNYSIGQKQLICLARAILLKNSILVLDEATANLDPNTCATIQKTIQNNFSGCTVITIAHRIPTVMNSDKILVLEQGQVVEFGSPQSLLTNKYGSFYKAVQNAGLI